jgi:hypothetical protein
MRVWIVVAAAVAFGCVGKAPVDEDFSDLAGIDAKSDYFSSRLKLIGPIKDGDSPSVTYTSKPRFRGFQISGSAADVIDVWVRSTDGGDAVTWLVDQNFKVFAKNDDADDTTYDSHIQATLPSQSSKVFYLIFRDYSVRKHVFTITFSEKDSKIVDVPAPDTGSTAQAIAFAKLYATDAADRSFATDSHLIDKGALPAAAQTAYQEFSDALGADATYTAWRFRAGGAYAYAVLADAIDSSSHVYVSLFDSSGTWVAHGHTNDFANAPTLLWGLDIDDLTICRCGLSPSGWAGCEWPDGLIRGSDVSDCD